MRTFLCSTSTLDRVMCAIIQQLPGSRDRRHLLHIATFEPELQNEFEWPHLTNSTCSLISREVQVHSIINIFSIKSGTLTVRSGRVAVCLSRIPATASETLLLCE